MNQGTEGYSLTKKTEGRKSRDTVSLNWNACISDSLVRILVKSRKTMHKNKGRI
jgi:hypothetical protein